MRILVTVIAALLLALPVCGGVKIDFNNLHAWKYFGKIPFVPKVKFYSIPGDKNPDSCRMVIESKNASGLFVYYPGVDVNKTPVVRWRWRLTAPLNEIADKNDEQALVLYIGDGNSFTQRTVAYRWEGATEIGARVNKIYSAGAVKMGGICMRNKNTPVGKWVTEERNIINDFKSFFVDDMRNCGIAIGANSQYSKQHSIAEIDYIEFLTPEEAAADPIPESEK